MGISSEAKETAEHHTMCRLVLLTAESNCLISHLALLLSKVTLVMWHHFTESQVVVLFWFVSIFSIWEREQ
jgi:hypothetical protein